MFTTCYETSLLCSRDSVTQSEMKVMLFRIVVSSPPFFLSLFYLSFFFKNVVFHHLSGVCEEAKGEKVEMTGDSTLADSWLSFCFFFFK